MPGTYSQLLLHVAFSRKCRAPWIAPDVAERPYPYMGGVVRAEKGVLYDIGGCGDSSAPSGRTHPTAHHGLRDPKQRCRFTRGHNPPPLRGEKHVARHPFGAKSMWPVAPSGRRACGPPHHAQAVALSRRQGIRYTLPHGHHD